MKLDTYTIFSYCYLPTLGMKFSYKDKDEISYVLYKNAMDTKHKADICMSICRLSEKQ